MDSDIQLTEVDAHTLTDRPGREDHPQEPDGFSLPPVDRGKDAWLVLLGAFMTEALVWGMPFSFGLFQEYYSLHEPFSSESSIATIGTTSQAIMYLSTLGLMHVLNRWPRLRRIATFVGVPIMALSLVLASFAESVWQLILTQGVLYGIGGTILYSPTVLFLDEWFVQRKGFAYGLMWVRQFDMAGSRGVLQSV
jgi:MFS family permease